MVVVSDRRKGDHAVGFGIGNQRTLNQYVPVVPVFVIGLDGNTRIDGQGFAGRHGHITHQIIRHVGQIGQ